ncbi:hypothetical protein U1Q18_005154, partial [Sarracenia purpurea var. burkii]
MEGQNEFSTSEASDSAWSDMMQDLSFLQKISREENQVNQSSETTLKKRWNFDEQEEHTDELIISIMRSSENTQLDQQNCKRLVQVLESVNCLSNPHSGNCALKEAVLHDSDMNQCEDKNNLCICPSWLKKTMKAFYFLNIYSAHLQLQQEKTTLTCLKGALDQLNKFGLQIGIADLEHLSVLCPK